MQAVICDTWSCHDDLNSTGLVLTVFFVLCRFSLLVPSFLSSFTSCARLILSVQSGVLQGGR